MNRCLDKKGTNFGLVSQYCPHFVLLQGDQAENGKMIKSHFCPTFVSHLSHFCPLSHFCLDPVFQFSVLSWSGLVFVLIGLKNVPLLSSFGPLSPWKMVRTNTGQSLNFIIFPFSTWSPCSWTKSGQYWDSHMSKVCPLFVQAPYSI